MLLSSAEDTRKCETTERISAGAVGWHLSQYQKPNTMKWRSSRWQRCHLKKVLLTYPSDDKAWLWALAACSILRKQISFPCQKRRMCYIRLYGPVRAWNYVSSYDMWWCPQLHVDRPGYTNLRRCQLCQTPGGIYLIVTMEDTMKKKTVWDAGRAFALAEDIVL